MRFRLLVESSEYGGLAAHWTWASKNGGRGRIRTDERAKRADLQSASFSHLDTLPAKESGIID